MGLTLSWLVSRFHLEKMQIFHLGNVSLAGSFMVGVVLRLCHLFKLFEESLVEIS